MTRRCATEAEKQQGRNDLARVLQKYCSAPSRNAFIVDDESRILELCHMFPDLAKEKIVIKEDGCSQYPLVCMLFKSNSIANIRTFCERHPQALLTPDEQGNLPLHVVCRNSGLLRHAETISWLARQCPASVSRINQHGNLPIHSLFSSFLWHPILEESIVTLLNIHPESLVIPNSEGIFLFEYALKYNVSANAFKMLLAQVPLNTKSATIYSRIRICQEKAHIFSRMLPQLRSLKILDAKISVEAWCWLMKCLSNNSTISRLCIVLREDLATNKIASQALRDMLLINTTIKDLSLRVDVPRLSPRTMKWDLTSTIIPLMKRNQLTSLALANVKVNILPSIAQVLQKNTSLKSLALPYHGKYNAELDLLVEVLQHHNTTVHEITFPCNSLFRYQNEKHIEYYTKLNRFGRGHVRNPSTTMDDFVCLFDNLTKEVHLYIIKKSRGSIRVEDNNKHPKILILNDAEADADWLDICYGLLRDNPSTWSILASLS